MLRIVVVAVALAVTAAPCLAADDIAPPQQPQATVPDAPRSEPQAPEPSPEAVGVAEQIIDVTGAKRHSLEVIDAMIPTAIATLKRAVPDIPDEVLAQFKAAFRQEVEKSLPDMLHTEARLYAVHFSAAELDQLLAFYRTPLGQKMLVEQPKIFTEIIPISQAWGRQVGARAMQTAIESLRQEGVKI